MFRYKQNLDAATKIDDIFNVFIFFYFALLFFGIVTRVESVIAIFEGSDKTVSQVILPLLYIGLMLFALFYTIKETSSVNEESATTKRLLYEYVLSTDPKDRDPDYYEEVILHSILF